MSRSEVERLSDKVFAVCGPGRYLFSPSGNNDQVRLFRPLVFYRPDNLPHMILVEMAGEKENPRLYLNSDLSSH